MLLIYYFCQPVPPKWAVEPMDVSVLRNQPAMLNCQAQGVPQPSTVWKRATGIYKNSLFFYVEASHRQIFLFIRRSIGSHLTEGNQVFGSSKNHTSAHKNCVVDTLRLTKLKSWFLSVKCSLIQSILTIGMLQRLLVISKLKRDKHSKSKFGYFVRQN